MLGKGGTLHFMRLPRFVIVATALSVSVACSESSSDDKPVQKTPSTQKPATAKAQTTQKADKPKVGSAAKPTKPAKTKAAVAGM